jgi:hypothetical protein
MVKLEVGEPVKVPLPVTVPLTVNLNPFKVITPESDILLTVTSAGNVGCMPPDGIITLAVGAGTPPHQLPAVFQLTSTAPVHVPAAFTFICTPPAGPAKVPVQGAAVFSICTQYVVVLPGETVRVEFVAPPIGDVPTTAPVPHW